MELYLTPKLVNFISFLFGCLLTWVGYFCYVKYQKDKLKTKSWYEQALNRIVIEYLAPGLISYREFVALLHKITKMGNYTGIYREAIYNFIKDLKEQSDFDFLDGVFDEKKIKKEENPIEINANVDKHKKISSDFENKNPF